MGPKGWWHNSIITEQLKRIYGGNSRKSKAGLLETAKLKTVIDRYQVSLDFVEDLKMVENDLSAHSPHCVESVTNFLQNFFITHHWKNYTSFYTSLQPDNISITHHWRENVAHTAQQAL